MTTSRTILIVDDVHPILTEGLTNLGYEVLYLPGLSKEVAKRDYHHVYGLVIRTGFTVDRDFLEAYSQLKFIARAGSGMDNVDEDFAEELGIICLNAPEGNCDAVGEHALGLLLSLTRNIVTSIQEVRQGLWRREENRGLELSEMTVAIIGFGHTGQAFAKKLSGFGCRILYIDREKKEGVSHLALESDWPTVFKEADVLSFHIPLDDKNKRVINRDLINAMEKKFFLLNLSRGGIMHTQDVWNGIIEEKILGAGFDVWENEKIHLWNSAEKELFELMSVSGKLILTPHIGGWTTASYRKISEVLLKKIRTRCS